MHNRLGRFFTTLFRYPLLVLISVLVAVLLLASQIPRLTLDASAESLVLEGDQALELFREVNKRYGSESFLLVTYAPDAELYSDAVLGRLAGLRDELAALPGVTSVTSILDVPLLYSPPVSLSNLDRDIRYLHEPDVNRELAAREFRESPLYRQLLTSKDGGTTALQINLQRDEGYFERLDARDSLREKQHREGLSGQESAALKQAEKAFRDYAVTANERQRDLVSAVRLILDGHRDHATIFLGGVPMIATDMIAFIENDLLIFGGATVLFIIVLMAVIFRRVRWIVLPLATCLLAASAMLGFIAWIEWQLTVISSNFVALLLIITLSVSIHLVVRFREYQQETPDASQRALVIRTLVFMAKPCLYTSLTTLVAFASLVVSGIRPVIDFGWMMTIGVLAALLAAFTILPAGLMLLPRIRSEFRPRYRPLTHYFARITDHHGTAVLAVSAALLFLAAVGISRLQVENRFIDYFHETTEIYQGMVVIDRELGGTIPLDVLLTAPEPTAASETNSEDPFAGAFDEATGDDPFATTAAPQAGYWYSRSGLEELTRVHRFLEALDETGKVLSLASLYAVLKDISGDELDDFQLALVRKNLPEDVRRQLVQSYLAPGGNEARLNVRVMETSRSLKREALLEKIQGFLVDEMGYPPQRVHMTGMLVLYNNMLQSLFVSQIATLGAVFIAITLMFTLLFRSLYLALIAIAPNLLAAGTVLGVMGWTGIPLDMMTITIAAITVGIGVDHSIHYIHRFRNEFARDHDYRATLYRCHASIGRAMFYTSVIIIAGFAILALSNFTPTLYFGLLTGLAMLSALLGALLLLPKLLVLLKPLGK